MSGHLNTLQGRRLEDHSLAISDLRSPVLEGRLTRINMSALAHASPNALDTSCFFRCSALRSRDDDGSRAYDEHQGIINVSDRTIESIQLLRVVNGITAELRSSQQPATRPQCSLTLHELEHNGVHGLATQFIALHDSMGSCPDVGSAAPQKYATAYSTPAHGYSRAQHDMATTCVSSQPRLGNHTPAPWPREPSTPRPPARRQQRS